MRCKKCGKTKKNNINRLKCWREHQLCGRCNLLENPEEYPRSITAKQYIEIEKIARHTSLLCRRGKHQSLKVNQKCKGIKTGKKKCLCECHAVRITV